MTVATVDAPVADLRWFYVWIAGFCVLVAIGGFWPTYWGPLAAGNFVEGAAVLHIHGALFTAWPLLFLAQTWLAATGRIGWHRSLGMLGVALASAMVFVGLWTVVYSIGVQSAAGDPFHARSFAILSVLKLALFATLVAVAVANVTRPEIHKRLMVVASLSLLPGAMARILFALFAPEGSPQRPGLGVAPPFIVTIPTSVVFDLIFLGIVLYDWRRNGRLHPVYVIGGVAFVAMQVLRVPLATTAEWHAVAEWLVRMAGS